MFDWVLKTPLRASIKAPVSSAAIRLNIFSFYFLNFYFFQYSKTIFKFCCTRLIFMQTNIYLKHTQVCIFLVVTKTKQWCLIISKEILTILIWRKLNMFNFFILKWKRIKSSFFVKYTVILKMIILKWSCILALRVISQINRVY